jgi:hypothetical protein
MINESTISQFRDIIEDIKTSQSQSERIRKSFELCEVVFETTITDSKQLINLSANNLLIEPIISLEKVTCAINEILSELLKYLDEDLQGSDFLKEIEDKMQQLEDLKNEFFLKQKQYKTLEEIKQTSNILQMEINQLETAIVQYIEIDLYKLENEKKDLQIKLQDLEAKEGINLQIYNKHFKVNQGISIYCDELEQLSFIIKDKLIEMDSKLNLYRKNKW